MHANSSGGTRPIVLIVGLGRSGSNWLLRMFDASPQTFCRNEPLGIATSPVHDLPVATPENHDQMATAWDHFVDWTINHQGERDTRLGAPKHHYRSLAQRAQLIDPVARRRVRQQLRRFPSRYRQAEWRTPSAFVDQRAFDRSTAVIKATGLRPDQCAWVLEHRPDVQVVHLVRHPGGMLHSLVNRFVDHLDAEVRTAEVAKYTERFATVGETNPPSATAQLPTIPDTPTLEEAFAWTWLQDNERLHASGDGRTNYNLVVYDDMVKDPAGTARDLYARCGLSYAPDVASRIDQLKENNVWRDLAGSSQHVATRWRTEARTDIVELAERVLAHSSLAPHFAT